MLCVETAQPVDEARRERIETDLLQLARSHSRFKTVRQVLFHPGFPVDIRHNAKIGREQLAQWATEKLGASR